MALGTPQLIGTNNNTSGATLAAAVGVAGVPVGATIIVFVGEAANVAPGSGSLVDTAGNTYTAAVSGSLNNAQANGYGIIYIAKNAVALVNGNSITFTKGLSGAKCAIQAWYLTGGNPSVNPDTGAANAGGSSATPSVTSGTPAVANDVVFGAVIIQGSAGIFTQDINYTTGPNEEKTGTGNTDVRLNGGYLVNTGTGAKTYAPLYTASKLWVALTVHIEVQITYSLTADQGSFALNGQAASFLRALLLSSAVGSFALTGQAAISQRALIADQGSFALTGEAATLIYGKILTAAQGAFTFTGVQAGKKRKYVVEAKRGRFKFTFGSIGAAETIQTFAVLPERSTYALYNSTNPVGYNTTRGGAGYYVNDMDGVTYFADCTWLLNEADGEYTAFMTTYRLLTETSDAALKFSYTLLTDLSELTTHDVRFVPGTFKMTNRGNLYTVSAQLEIVPIEYDDDDVTEFLDEYESDFPVI